jgi:hypothetical protein
MEFSGDVDKYRLDKALQDLLWDKDLVNSKGDKQEIYRLKVQMMGATFCILQELNYHLS